MPCGDSAEQDREESDIENKRIKILLCAICKTLNKEELKSIETQGYNLYDNLYDWYLKHLECDIRSAQYWMELYTMNNKLDEAENSRREGNIAICELKRIMNNHYSSNLSFS